MLTMMILLKENKSGIKTYVDNISNTIKNMRDIAAEST